MAHVVAGGGPLACGRGAAAAAAAVALFARVRVLPVQQLPPVGCVVRGGRGLLQQLHDRMHEPRGKRRGGAHDAGAVRRSLPPRADAHRRIVLRPPRNLRTAVSYTGQVQLHSWGTTARRVKTSLQYICYTGLVTSAPNCDSRRQIYPTWLKRTGYYHTGNSLAMSGMHGPSTLRHAHVH